RASSCPFKNGRCVWTIRRLQRQQGPWQTLAGTAGSGETGPSIRRPQRQQGPWQNPCWRCGLGGSLRSHRMTPLPPAADAAGQGDHIGVTHFWQVVGCQGRAITAAAVEHNRRCRVGDALLDVAFNDALAEVNGAWQMVPGILAFFAYVDQVELV